MRKEIIILEDTIVNNYTYLLRHYPDTQKLLAQITTILDFGMQDENIEHFFQTNRMSIIKIIELLKKNVSSH
ncbi:hypothetical protein [Sulfurimonas sp.]